jgi:DNA-binding response OmpR family regulator
MDLDDIAAGLRSFSLRPVVLPRTDNLPDFLARWKPLVAVIGGGLEAGDRVIQRLVENVIPIVCVGNAEQFRLITSPDAIAVEIPLPAGGREVGNAAKLVAGDADDRTSDVRQVGPVSLDLLQRVVAVDGRVVKLPPREFFLLAELALHPRRPIPPAELGRRAWPYLPGGTNEDVRRSIYRLRRLIGDHLRTPPLIHTRRGFGYVLEPARPAGGMPPSVI